MSAAIFLHSRNSNRGNLGFGLAGFTVSDLQLKAPNYPAPKLVGDGNDWLNTDGKALQLQKGKVYLIDFWEYTCVNCIRTLPYVKKWNQKYAKDGLVIIGIHTPEFGFAHNRTNVEAAVRMFGITYPVLVDSQYRNWQLWQGDSGYWPRKFLVNAEGNVVYDHAGEGGYQETEREIQKLLLQAHPGLQLPPLMKLIRPEDTPGAVCYPVTPEMYAGQRGFESGQLGNVAGFSLGNIAEYRIMGKEVDGRFYLQGLWQTNSEFLRHARSSPDYSDFISVRYHALSANAVIRPEDGVPFRIYVLQDGLPVKADDRGQDIRVDKNGRTYILVDSPRMYQLTKNLHYGSHEIRLMTNSTGFGLYSFTYSSCEEP
jgi:thiol-disulfide isomerase/thioredoxin